MLLMEDVACNLNEDFKYMVYQRVRVLKRDENITPHQIITNYFQFTF